jgi:hypothetical protein
VTPLGARRILVPGDVFVLLCVEVQKLSDTLLLAAQELNKEVHMLPEDCKTLRNLLAANIQLGGINGILRAIVVDDDPEAPPTPLLPNGGGAPPAGSNGGNGACHA